MRQAESDAVLAAARQRFFNGGELPEGLVPAPILRSWQRCAEQGLDVGQTIRAEPVTAAELRALHEQNETLRMLSRSELVSLRAEARLTDSVVILTDAGGLVLDTAGSPQFADQASRVALRPGVAWSETSTGTNAIGTALYERRAIEVHGAEHFFEPHGMLTCAAAPIFDPFGKLAGVLDMSGHASVPHTHALGLVRLAVEQIEHRYFTDRFEGCTIVRFHRSADLLGTVREGILVFEGDRLVAGNRRALRLVGLERSALRRTSLREIFEPTQVAAETGALRALNGEAFFASIALPGAAPSRRIAAGPRPQGKTAEPYLSADSRVALSRAVRLVDAEIPILIQGETGSGKEVFARHLHSLTIRAGKPFVAINCAALPEHLIEAELFGYEPGAFTGARKQGAKGLVLQAHGGILFLDEIGDMPLSLQGRLLRLLQDREVTPLGGGAPVKSDFVAISATNRPLRQLIDSGQFRSDLYYRIAQYTIELPVLRDLPDRAAVIDTLWRQIGEPAASLPASLLSRLAAHDWPGNFRELSGCLRAIAALSDPGNPVLVEALPLIDRSAPPAGTGEDEQQPLEAMTESAMRAALSRNGGNVSRAARTLGIDRSTLYRRLLWKDRSDG